MTGPEINSYKEILDKINSLSVELSQIPNDSDLFKFLGQKLKDLTGAIGVSVAEYNSNKRVLIIRHIETDSAIFDKILKSTGIKLDNIETPVNEKIYKEITNSLVGYRDNLTDTTFGAVPRFVSNIIRSTIGIDRFIGLAFMFENELYGTAVLAFKKGTVLPEEDLLRSFAALAWVSLRRKKVEDDLKESNSRYKSILNNSPNAILIRVKDKLVYANRYGQQITGYNSEELDKMSMFELIHPDDHSIVQKNMMRRMNGENVEDYEIRVITKSGETKIFLHRTNLINYYGEVASISVMTDLTEIRKKDSELRESEKKYRNIIENIQDVYYRTDKYGKLIMVSPSGLKQFGFNDYSEVIGKPVAETFYKDPEQRNEILNALKSNGKVKNFPVTLQKNDGSVITFHATSHLVLDEKGNFAGVEGILQDITKEKEAEEEQRKSEQRARKQRLFLATVSVNEDITSGDMENAAKVLTSSASKAIDVERSSIWFFSVDGSKLVCKDLYESTTNTHSEGTVLKSADYPAYFNAISKENRIVASDALNDPRTKEFFLNYLKPIGITSMLDSGIYVSGKLVGVVCFEHIGPKRIWHSDEESFSGIIASLISQTIVNSDRRKAEKALKESEEKYRILFERSNDAMLVIDNNIFIDCNDATVRMLKYNSKTELLNTHPSKLSPEIQPDGSSSFEKAEAMMAIAVSNGSHNFEWMHRRSDGENFWVDVSLTLIPFKDKNIIHTAWRDISDKKKAEEDREKLQVQLIQSQKMESIGRLAGGISHDFNNLLQPILGMSDIMLYSMPDSDPNKSRVEKIRKAALSSRDLINQLLVFTRMKPVEMIPVNLNELITEFMPILKRTIKENIKIDTIFEKDIYNILGDTSQIQQIIMNLSVNAQDAMPDGGMLKIETHNLNIEKQIKNRFGDLDPGKYVQLKVSDSGHGMDKETADRVFEPFFTTKGIGKGTGLGLATVFGIVKQYNGTIDVDSYPGNGTSFIIAFPTTTELVEKDSGEHLKRIIKSRNETVLIVEDEQQVRELVIEILKPMGFNILSAENGQKAIDYIRTNSDSIGLLISDIILPDLNGKIIYDELSKVKPEIKSLFMSGYTAEVISSENFENEKFNFIQKPFLMDDFIHKIEKILDED